MNSQTTKNSQEQKINKKQNQKKSRNRQKESKKIFLAGLCVEFSKTEITSFFKSKYDSECFSLKINFDKLGRNAGWGILKVTIPAIRSAILKQKMFTLKGRRFYANPYLRGEKLKGYREEVQNRRVYIKGIPANMTTQRLCEELRRFFEIEDAYVIKKYEHRFSRESTHSGFGYVMFHTLEQAREALEVGKVVLETGAELVLSKFDRFGQERGDPGGQSLKERRSKAGRRMENFDSFEYVKKDSLAEEVPEAQSKAAEGVPRPKETPSPYINSQVGSKERERDDYFKEEAQVMIQAGEFERGEKIAITKKIAEIDSQNIGIYHRNQKKSKIPLEDEHLSHFSQPSFFDKQNFKKKKSNQYVGNFPQQRSSYDSQKQQKLVTRDQRFQQSSKPRNNKIASSGFNQQRFSRSSAHSYREKDQDPYRQSSHFQNQEQEESHDYRGAESHLQREEEDWDYDSYYYSQRQPEERHYHKNSLWGLQQQGELEPIHEVIMDDRDYLLEPDEDYFEGAYPPPHPYQYHHQNSQNRAKNANINNNPRTRRKNKNDYHRPTWTRTNIVQQGAWWSDPDIRGSNRTPAPNSSRLIDRHENRDLSARELNSYQHSTNENYLQIEKRLDHQKPLHYRFQKDNRDLEPSFGRLTGQRIPPRGQGNHESLINRKKNRTNNSNSHYLTLPPASREPPTNRTEPFSQADNNVRRQELNHNAHVGDFTPGSSSFMRDQPQLEVFEFDWGLGPIRRLEEAMTSVRVGYLLGNHYDRNLKFRKENKQEE